MAPSQLQEELEGFEDEEEDDGSFNLGKGKKVIDF